MIAGSTLQVELNVLLGHRLERILQRGEMRVGELLGDRDLRRHLALVARDQRLVGPDHLAHREQAPLARDEQQEIRREPADAGLLEHAGQRLRLLVGA